ncbi:hypothetical protein AB205_0065120 [Aquarana catesbeiana]|uniref:Uncharacterized protein n=1 Tax=Aquarana catesbeiana TaxID=8400 RepID=A0A2G9SLS3_AQUCT|nr:hypothetical protein AB205_0065120 [Aquarana catesbeiana]
MRNDFPCEPGSGVTSLQTEDQLLIDCVSCGEEPLISQVCCPGRFPRKTVTGK